MIEAGDRIVATNPDDGGNGSGIVAQAIDCDYGDWAVVLWNGYKEGRRAFQFTVVNELAVEIVERNLTCPTLPDEVSKKLRAIALKSANHAYSRFDDQMESEIHNMQETLVANGMREGLRQAINDGRSKGMTDGDLRVAIRDMGVKIAQRDLPAGHLAIKQAMLVAQCREAEALLEKSK